MPSLTVAHVRRNEPRTDPAGPATAPACMQRRDLLVAEPGRGEHLAGVLAEPGTRRPDRVGGGPAQLDRRPEQLHRLGGPGLIKLDDHLAGGHELGAERLVELEHRLEAAVVLGGELAPLLTGPRGEDLGDGAVRVGAGRVERMIDEVLAADTETPGAPELRLERAERDVAVRRRRTAGSR